MLKCFAANRCATSQNLSSLVSCNVCPNRTVLRPIGREVAGRLVHPFYITERCVRRTNYVGVDGPVIGGKQLIELVDCEHDGLLVYVLTKPVIVASPRVDHAPVGGSEVGACDSEAERAGYRDGGD